MRLADFAGINANTTDAKAALLPKIASPISNASMLMQGSKTGGGKISSLIRNAVKESENLMVAPDIRLPEGDFEQAKNFFEFATSKRFLNQKPYIPQAIIGIQLFAEYCTRCTDLDYINGGWSVHDKYATLKRKIALLEHGKCPHCGARKSEMIADGSLNFYQEGSIVAGQRSGKSAVCAMISSYLLHWLLKLQRPNEVYGLMNSNVLHGTFVALTYAQAKDTLWEPFYGTVLDSPWFQEYHSMLEEYRNRTGEELANIKDTFIMYKHRRLFFYPAAPDKRVLRGRTRSFSAIDELGWFPNDVASLKNVKMNAQEVYISLERSLRTVRSKANRLVKQGFDNVPTGYFFNVSSPSSVRDKIMELYRKSIGSRSILGWQRPTWEMNPDVTREDLDPEFMKDPVGSMRDYGAQPPLTNSAFITNKDEVIACYSKRSNPLIMAQKVKKYNDGGVTTFGVISKIGQTTRKSVLALDAGVSNNSFAFAVATLRTGKVSIDVIGEVIPYGGMIINYSMVQEMLEELIEARNIVLVAADRWNSLKPLHDIRDSFDIPFRIYSLKYPDMVMFKDYLTGGQLTFPKPKWELKNILEYDQTDYPKCFLGHPAEHMVLQLLTVQDTKSNVIKGDNLTDDIVRASMLATAMLLDEKNAEIFANDMGEDVAAGPPVPLSQMMVMRTGSSGGGSSSTPSSNASDGKALGNMRIRKS